MTPIPFDTEVTVGSDETGHHMEREMIIMIGILDINEITIEDTIRHQALDFAKLVVGDRALRLIVTVPMLIVGVVEMTSKTGDPILTADLLIITFMTPSLPLMLMGGGR
ncbi:hypothetical protein EON65_45540, partial [archaeon]